MEAAALSGDQRASVAVAVQPRGRLVELRRPKERTRRPRALGRVKIIRRPHVKPERKVQRKAPKVREAWANETRRRSDLAMHACTNQTQLRSLDACVQNGEKPAKKTVKRVVFAAGV